MSLYDFFFREEPQAAYLRRIAEESERANRLREHETGDLAWQNQELQRRIKRLEYDVGSLALVLASVLKKLDEKGHVTRVEIKEVIAELDLLDKASDGKISVDDLRGGSFFDRP